MLLPNDTLTFEQELEVFSYRARMNNLTYNQGKNSIQKCICGIIMNNEHLYQCESLSEGRKCQISYIANHEKVKWKYEYFWNLPRPSIILHQAARLIVFSKEIYIQHIPWGICLWTLSVLCWATADHGRFSEKIGNFLVRFENMITWLKIEKNI